MYEAKVGGLCDECPAVSEALREAEKLESGTLAIPGVNSLQFSPDLLALVFLSLQVNRAARALLVLEEIKGLGALAGQEACPGAVEPSESELSREFAKRFEAIIGEPPELATIRCGISARWSRNLADRLREEFES